MNVNALIAVAESMEPALPEEIQGYEDEQDPGVSGRWIIDSRTSADWAMQRMDECAAEADAIDAQYEAALARLKARRDQLVERTNRGSAFFEFKLKEWACRNRASLLNGKAKSIPMLHGVIGWRKKGGNLKVVDAAALEAWLLAQPIEAGLYRMKVEPEMRAIQALFKSLGEIPPGCEVQPEFDDVYVKPEAPETALVRGK
jgi:phage host-nuclease inhibitor protein Gam